MENKFEDHEEVPTESTRSRLFLRQAPRFRRQLRLMPGAGELPVITDETKAAKRRRKRTYSRGV